MPELHIIDKFTERGGSTLPTNGFVAVGIAPSSEIDICKVGTNVLGPMQLVPFSTGVEAIRGERLNMLNDGATLASSAPLGATLALWLFKQGEPLVVPGPRAPRLYTSNMFTMAVAAPSTGTLPNLRVPFSGRKQAAVSAFAFDAAAPAVSLLIRGLNYGARFDFPVTGIGPFRDDAPVVAFAGSAGGITGGGVIRYVGGGGDLQEAFDELEIYLYGSASSTGYLVVEVSGERG